MEAVSVLGWVQASKGVVKEKYKTPKGLLVSPSIWVGRRLPVGLRLRLDHPQVPAVAAGSAAGS